MIAISSQKGGVAKTTTCLALGATLAELGLNVLVADLDPQAHLTQALGFSVERIRRTIGDVLLNQASLLSITRQTNTPGLDLMPANEGLILIDKLLYNLDGYEYRLKNHLAALSNQIYNIVLFDCAPVFGPLTVNALSASKLVIIPTTCDYFSVQSLENYLDLLDLLKRKSNPEIEYKLLITMYDSRTKLSRFILEQYRQKYSSQLLETVIPLDVKLRESQIFNQTITAYAPSSRGATDYRSLAKELLTCVKMTN